MKRCLWMLLILCTLAAPAFAATTVYLKKGGVIKAKSAWRSQGRVYVLVNRDTITDFSTTEIDLKRTFSSKHRIAKKQAHRLNSRETAAAASSGVAAGHKKADSGIKSLLPELPKLPEKSPESLVQSSGAGGTIRQHKKEMAERAGE